MSDWNMKHCLLPDPEAVLPAPARHLGSLVGRASGRRPRLGESQRL
jgi:hypothetical protein